MRTKTITKLCTVAMTLAAITSALATDQPQPEVVAADVLVMRPALFAATVVGSAIFIVALPVAAISKRVKSTAHALVVAPAQATFTRPLGDFDYHESRSNKPESSVASRY